MGDANEWSRVLSEAVHKLRHVFLVIETAVCTSADKRVLLKSTTP